MILFETDALAASGAGLFGIWLNRNRLESTCDDIHTIFSLNELHGEKSITTAKKGGMILALKGPDKSHRPLRSKCRGR